MSLVALRCPHCGHALPVAPERRIFACEHGHGAFRAAEGRLWPLSLRRVLPRRPLPPEGDLVLLPLWLLQVDATSQRAGGLPAELRLPAIGVQRLPLVLDLARNLTKHQAPWIEDDAHGLAFDGAELDVDDAQAIAELVALGLRPGWPPDGEVEAFRLAATAARLVLLPAWRHAGRLEELVGGVSCAASIFEESALTDRRASWTGTTGRLAR